MEKLFTLLELQRQAQEAESKDYLVHLIVNETIKLIPYNRSIFWDGEIIKKISGTDIFDGNSKYAQATLTKIKNISNRASIENPVLQDEGKGVYLSFQTPREGFVGGVYLEREKAFDDAEIRILEELSVTFARLLALWKYRDTSGFYGSFSSLKKKQKYIWMLCILSCFLPVRMTITAPMEIIPRDADVITIPYDGLMDEIMVNPGDTVKEGDILAVMEQDSLKLQTEMTEQEMEITQQSIFRLQRESLTMPEKKAQLVELQQDLEAKKIASNYAKILKERAQIKSDRDGIAIFSESVSMKGKPLRAGDKLMMIANPKEYDVFVRVPIEAMVPIDQSARVSFFMNTSPFLSHEGNIKSIGYQAGIDPDGLMTYKILVNTPTDNLRIGAKGTAKIYGGWTILSYAVLRRPLLTVRNLMGI